MPTLYILCGPSGAGKTTWAKDFIKTRNIHYVSRDAIRFSLVKEDEEYFSHEKEIFKKFVKEITNALLRDEDVIADATHLNKSSRNKLIRAIDRHITNYEIVYVVFKTKLETCLKQNSLREGREKVPESVIRNMFHVYSEPSLYEDERIVGSIEVIDE